MRALILLSLLLLPVCSAAQPTVVDMAGIDPGQHSRDLVVCDRECHTGQNGFIEAGNPLANCMRRKGYKVLVAN